MVKLKSSSIVKSTKKIKKAGLVFGTALLMTGFISCGDNVEYTSEEVMTPNNGIVTEVKETQKDLFKITNEEVVATIADSRIIAEYMDGARDTFTLEEARLVDADNPARSRSMNGILMGGMMGYMMGKSMKTPVSRAAYANDGAYNKSSSTNSSKLKSTATKKTVKTPKKGFGSSKSSRSYGG